MNMKINWDALGISASVACAIHCAFLPLVTTSLPLFGFEIVENVRFEYAMIFLAFGVGAYSLYHGHKKHHQQWLPMLLFMAGIACLLAKQIWHNWELYFLVPAVALVVLAHFVNYRYCRAHDYAHKESCHH